VFPTKFRKVINPKANRAKIKSKKITIDGTTFDSELEGYMYTLLKNAGLKFSYEGIKYPLLPKYDYPVECYERPFSGASKEFKDRRLVRAMVYTPDFVGENEEWIIETKGKANESFPLRWKIFKAIMKRRANPPILFLPATQVECREVLKILKSKGYGE